MKRGLILWKTAAAHARVIIVIAGSLGPAASGSALAQPGPGASEATPVVPSEPSVDLAPKQLEFIKTAPATVHRFTIEKSAVGSIDFNQDAQVQVFTPYQGRIIAIFVRLGDHVKVGQDLFTIDSSDLLQAESTLVQTAGVYELTTKSLARARKLVPAGGGAQKDLDQAISDQQTAEGNLKAARDALHVFGKAEADIDRIVAERRIDGALVVKSPSDGVITARNGGPGLLVQPGSAPAPLTVANLSQKWMVANFTESDSLALRRGQEVSGHILALPGLIFRGRITAVGESIDPATRRFMVRTEIADPENVLRPGMFANFSVSTGATFEAVALPLNGVVRKGDGTMTVWATQDGHRFTQRLVKLGLQQDGLHQISDGIRAGETVVVDNAVFLNNVLEAGPSN